MSLDREIIHSVMGFHVRKTVNCFVCMKAGLVLIIIVPCMLLAPWLRCNTNDNLLTDICRLNAF